MTTIKLCGMGRNDKNHELCNTIQDSLNNIINDYHKIVMKGEKKENTNIELLTHSGSAPIKGWVNNGLEGYDKISDAIHKYAIDKHDYAEIHYRDNYVWHAWLKINTNHFKFHYRPNPTIEIIPELVNITSNRLDLSDRFEPNDYQALFVEDFTYFNSTYPGIGLLHRCLIVIRLLNERFDETPRFVLELVQLQQIYYPLFHFINLFIHIAMLHIAFGRVDYFIIFDNKSSTKSDKEYSILDGNLLRLSEENYKDSKNHKVINIKEGLDKILKKYYSVIERSLYKDKDKDKDIHSLVIEICTTIGITITDLYKPYYLDNPLSNSKKSTSKQSSRLSNSKKSTSKQSSRLSNSKKSRPIPKPRPLSTKKSRPKSRPIPKPRPLSTKKSRPLSTKKSRPRPIPKPRPLSTKKSRPRPIPKPRPLSTKKSRPIPPSYYNISPLPPSYYNIMKAN